MSFSAFSCACPAVMTASSWSRLHQPFLHTYQQRKSERTMLFTRRALLLESAMRCDAPGCDDGRTLRASPSCSAVKLSATMFRGDAVVRESPEERKVDVEERRRAALSARLESSAPRPLVASYTIASQTARGSSKGIMAIRMEPST